MPHRPEQYGTPCQLYVDLEAGGPALDAGDVVATEAGSFYLVREGWWSSGTPWRRYLRCVRLNPADVDPDAVALVLRWYPRPRTPREV